MVQGNRNRLSRVPRLTQLDAPGNSNESHAWLSGAGIPFPYFDFV